MRAPLQISSKRVPHVTSLLEVPFLKDCVPAPNPFQKMDCNPPPLQQNEKGLQSFLQSSLRSFRVPFKGIGETPEATEVVTIDKLWPKNPIKF